MFVDVIHMLFPSQCIKHMKVKDSHLDGIRKECYCERCGRSLAIKTKLSSKPYVIHKKLNRWAKNFRNVMCEEFRL